jgi:alpha-glucosidase
MITIERNATGFAILLDGLPLISHSCDAPFVYAGQGREQIEMYRGNFQIEDRLVERVALRDWELIGDDLDSGLIVRFRSAGYAVDCQLRKEAGHLVLRFQVPATSGTSTNPVTSETSTNPATSGASARADSIGSSANRWWFRLAALPAEHVYGGGEQFSHFDLSGRRFPLWASEQGVGRNKRTPITFQADVNDRCGGDYWWTFFPQPTMLSSRHYWLHADCTAYAAFDFRDPRYHELEFWDLPRQLTLASAPSMLELVSKLTELLGRQPELPDWVHDGVILGLQGGTAACEARLRRAQAQGVPVAGIWAQDWEGIRMTSFGQRLMWNWAWSPDRYPDLPASISRWRTEGIRFLGYSNPYVAADGPLFAEAAARGFLAKNASGQDYLVDFGEFDAGIPDFTNPAAYAWYKQALRRNMVDFGLAGWMADFGEYLPSDTVLHDGRPAMLAHNEWPAIWARLNHEMLVEAGMQHEILFFMRAGFTGSQRWCPLMWAGDQNTDWSEDDGLPSVIPAALSLAMCGHGLHHSDIGGYTSLYGMKRSKELLLRWTEFAAFTPVMRGHEGNRPKDNWQLDDDDETLAGLARMGRVYVALKPYRKAIVTECSRKGIPVMRPLFMHYESDAATWTIKDQYLLGRDLLVAPVVTEAATGRQVHLPDDRWVHFWTGAVYAGGDHLLAAPLGLPPVFWRADSAWSTVFKAAAAAAAL